MNQVTPASLKYPLSVFNKKTLLSKRILFRFQYLPHLTLWQGASTNKMLGNFNTERFTIIKSKSIKTQYVYSGQWCTDRGIRIHTSGTEHVQSRATKIFKISIPGKRFVKGGVLQYENGSSQPKFYDNLWQQIWT